MPKPVARSRIPKISSVDALMRLAKDRNLPISRETANRRFAKSAAGEGPSAEEAASRLIREARHKQMLQGQLRKGRLIPLWEFEARLDLPEYTLHESKDVKKFKIGTTVYVTRREARRLEAKHLLEIERRKKEASEKKAEQKRAKAREKGLQPKRVSQPKKKPKAGKHEGGPPKKQPERPEAKRPVPGQGLGVKRSAANPETMELIAQWQRSPKLRGSKGRIMIIKRLLLKSRHLTPEQFKREAEPVLNRLVRGNQQ